MRPIQLSKNTQQRNTPQQALVAHCRVTVFVFCSLFVFFAYSHTWNKESSSL